jgi:hypothetical protein
MPNMQGLDRDWRTYAVSVRDVEELTGFRFFTALPADLAEQLRVRKPETRARAEKTAGKEKAPRSKGKAKASEVELPAFVEGCVVGNRQTKRYHLPTGRGYEVAKKSKNVVYFKSAKDAEAAGYVAAKR